MIAHKWFQELLARRPELTADEETSLRAHLQDCPACQRVAVAFALDAALLRSLPRPEPPAAIRQAVWARVRWPGAPRRP
jgi:anti-sigma factor RsiW